jgi:SpoVK/Ycf46/Vps4 family AAA+-type ATPase
MYMRLGRVVEHTHAALLSAVVAADAFHLAGLLDRDPMRPGHLYDRVLQETQRSVPSATLDNTTFKQFDSSSTRSFLAKFQPYRTGATSGTKTDESEATEPSDPKSERHLEIFAKLERLLERLSEKTPSISGEQLEQEINELRELKKDLAKGEEKRSTARLARDKKLGTYAFEPQQGQLGALTFNRVPTDNVSYDSVVGKSWRTVQEKLEPLIRHGELGYLYNFGSMRGRQNNNMLIIGPYGCGKNMFLRALMADPRTIGVKVTLDRLASVWHAQSERNTRKVFELAHEKRVQLDKPAVIGWDEFDSLYSTGRGGSVSDSIGEKMQKILQSVLDGDTIYEGVNLVALTNKPASIPPPIYRRFAHVVVIKPLEDAERISLLRSMMAGVPVADDFESSVCVGRPPWKDLRSGFHGLLAKSRSSRSSSSS